MVAGIAGVLLTALLASSAAPSHVALPGGAGGIGFDDLRWSEALHRVLVPAGRTGRLDLVDPRTGAVAAIEGFASARAPSRGHADGTTSADVGQGWIFAIDRTSRTVVVIDGGAERRIVTRVRLGASPDYVRWIAGLNEVWVTEPGVGVIEAFRIDGGSPPGLAKTASISVKGGPESLVVDAAHHRAYTNTLRDETVAIDLAAHAVLARWRNACHGARGIDLDAARGLVFVGCDEGKAVALDVAHDGKVVGVVNTAGGVDGIAYSARLGHLYVPGADSASLTVVGVGAGGALVALGNVPTARDAHCVATDDAGALYVCDPGHGRLLLLRDPYPSSANAPPAR